MKTVMKRFSLIVLALVFLLALCGCSPLQKLESPEIREKTEIVLDSLLKNDEDTAYSVIYSGIDRSEFSSVFSQLYAIFRGTESYKLSLIQYNTSISNGVSITQHTYRMTTERDDYKVIVSVAKGYDGLFSFYIESYNEEETGGYTGSIGHMQGADVWQWIILIAGILSAVFVIWMFIDCIRRKLRLKWLWLILIALASIVLTMTFAADKVNFRFNIGLYLQMSSLLRYSDGTSQLCLVIPLGAVIYFTQRKKLTIRPKKEDPLPEQADEISVQPAEAAITEKAIAEEPAVEENVSDEPSAETATEEAGS